ARSDINARPGGGDLPPLPSLRSAPPPQAGEGKLPRHLGRQILELAVLQIIIKPPALDLIHHLVEFRPRDGLVDEALAAAEAGEIPWMRGFELGRHGELPQRQI